MYENGVRVSADSTPTVTAIDIDTGEAVSVSGVVPEAVSGEGYDLYWTSLDPEEVTYNRRIRITWQYQLSGETFQSIENVFVVTPLVTPEDIYTRYPQFQTGGSDPKTYDQIQAMERKVRFVISSHTGQSFQDAGSTTFKIYGTGSDYLGLPEPVYELEYVAADDPKVVLYDKTLNPSGEIYERDDEGKVIDGTSYAPAPIEIVTWDKEQPWVIRKRFPLRNDWNDLYPKQHISSEYLDYRNIFENKRVYTVRAKSGWKVVPPEVQEAALLLVGDYFCPDVSFHEKQLESVTSADYNFKYDTNHFETTGNVFADQMLSQYIENRIHIF